MASIAVGVAERLRVDDYRFDLVISARANAWRGAGDLRGALAIWLALQTSRSCSRATR